MKKLLSSIVAVFAVLSYSTLAGAIPATSNPDQAISVLENEHQGSTVKPAKKPKKAHKPQKGSKKKTSPASSSTPAPSVPAESGTTESK